MWIHTLLLGKMNRILFGLEEDVASLHKIAA